MSNFRIRDCIVKEADLINRAIELGHSIVAITDHETIASAVRVEKIKKKVGDKITIVMGNEIYLCRDGLNSENFTKGEDKYYHFILLATDLIGYQQICELSTRAWQRSYMGSGMRRVPTYYQDIIDIIGSNPGHVIGSTACLGGMLGTQLLKFKNEPNPDLWNNIVNWCNLMESTFGGRGNFYLELQPSASKEQTYVNKQLIDISNKTGIPYIITTDTHYLTKEDREIHKAYLNSQNGDREVDSFYATTYLMDTEDLESHLELTKEELEIGYNNILAIRDKIQDYSILKPLKIPSLKWKEYNEEITQAWIDKIPMLKVFNESEFAGDAVLAQAVIAGIKRHKDLQNKEAYDEINSNLKMTWVSSEVNNAHWSSYYLNLQKIIDLCWEAGSIVGPGRGSGVGFILLYVLDITQINPLKEETKTFSWRFLNPERVSVLDVDFDIEGARRAQVLRKFREFYGEDRVSNVTTFRTEKSKSAILTAARGLGIDVDEAQYLASMIPADRGQLRTLKEVFYGDEEKDFKPIPAFVDAMTNDYPLLWEVAQKIEGLICGTGIHAGGVIFVDEPFTNSTGLMRAPDGTICTQFDLHDAEDVSLIKYDALSVEAMDKIHVCLDLLSDYGYIKKYPTLKETYEQALNIYKIDRTSEDMWKMIWEHKINSLFQMEQQSGIQGIKALKPTSVDDLAILNSAIRLMAQEKGGEVPVSKLSRFKRDNSLWDEEMDSYGLLPAEKDVLRPILSISYGLCIAQEQFMELVQLPELGGFSLTWADKLRKSIAKKNPAEYDKLTVEFMKVTEEKGVRKEFASYVWNVLIAMSKGYGFNQSHTLAYSLIALQEMNLAYLYPLIFWNCACLISNSGSLEENGTTNYDKIAIAISKMKSEGINIGLPNVNESKDIFIPDVENNRILYGLKAISGVNDDVITTIEANRPYSGIKDFMAKCHFGKSVMFNLIKAGAFDEVDKNFKSRTDIMIYFISQACEPKKKLNLQNFGGLIERGVVPKELEMQVRVFNFNKYIKKRKLGEYYDFDQACADFYKRFYDDKLDLLEVVNNRVVIKQKDWEKIYQSEMNLAREWIKDNQESALQEYNFKLFQELWESKASGNISKWEMDSLSFYYNEHELAHIDNKKYGIVNFFDLNAESDVDYYFKRGGKQIPIFKLSRIAGTVLAKNDGHSSITLLTVDGVVEVKMSKDQFAMFKKQISQVGADGKKHVIEKSWLSRGRKLMLTGYRRDNQFVLKTYANTASHQLYLIEDIVGDEMKIRHERFRPDGSLEEDEWDGGEY